MPRRLIVTADDFGLDLAVNEAVELAHGRGILTSASLMVGAKAAADAVARARGAPTLRVGLHVAVVDAVPVLPPRSIPALVGTGGCLRSDLVRAGLDFAFRPAAREALGREIEAQFESYAATGLALDHADAHKHLHLHPTVGRLIVEIGRRFGLLAVRVPAEPRAVSLRPWTTLLRRRLSRAGLLASDRVFGLAWSGRFDEARLLALLNELPEGLSEIYFHPSVSGDAGRAELAALTSPVVREAIDRQAIELTTYGTEGHRSA